MMKTIWISVVVATATLGFGCEIADDEQGDFEELSSEDATRFDAVDELLGPDGDPDAEQAAADGWDVCVTGKECGKKEFCQRPGLSCLHWGFCVPRPEGCFDLWDPVCGCDGQTYSNECYANAAGIDIGSLDACGGGDGPSVGPIDAAQ